MRLPYDAEDREIIRAGRNRVRGEVSDKESDDEAVGEPLAEEFWHDGRAAGKYGEHADRTLIVFFDHGRGLHVFVGGEGEDVESALEACGAESGEDFIFVRECLVIAAMVGQQHVHNGAGDEDDDR